MSRSKEKASSYAERHNIPRWYTDAQQLISDPDVNAIYIATPPSSHATYAIMAMKAGKPVYVEKPLASSYIDCQRINRVSEQTHVPCFVAYYRRRLPYFLKVKELVESGTIGKVTSVQIRFACPPRLLDYNSTALPWRVQRDIAGGGYFYDLAPHQIDLLQDIFGPRADSGQSGSKTQTRRPDPSRFSQGAEARHLCQRPHRDRWRRRTDLLLRLHLRAHHPPHRRRPPGVPHREPRARPTSPHTERCGTPATERHLHRGQHQRHQRQLGDGPHPGENIIKKVKSLKSADDFSSVRFSPCLRRFCLILGLEALYMTCMQTLSPYPVRSRGFDLSINEEC